MTAKTKAYIAAILYATIVGFSYLGTKTSVEITTPLLTLTWRYNMGFLGALALILLGIVRFDFRGKNLKNILLASSMYIAFMGLQTLGLMRVTSIEGSIIFPIVPIFVQIFAFFILKERIVPLQTAFIILSVTSVIILYVWGSVGLGQMDPLGFMILVIASICMALSNVYMRSVRKDFKALEMGSFIVILGAVFFNLILWIQILTDGSMAGAVYFSPFTSGSGLIFFIAIVYLGIPCMLFTASLITYALAHLEAAKATIFGNLSLLIGIVAGILVRGEPFFVYHFICAALIVVGVIGTNWVGQETSRLKTK